MTRLRIPVVPGAVLLLAVACGFALFGSAARAQQEQAQQEQAQSTRNFHNALAKAPEKARAMHSQVETEPDAAAAGGKLFDLHCAECHGKKAGGTRRGPSLLSLEMQQAPPGAIFWVLTNGVVRHGMPVWSKLPEPQRWQLVAFLQSLRSPGRQPPPGSAGQH